LIDGLITERCAVERRVRTDARVAYGKVEHDGVGLALLHLDREDDLALRRELDGVAH
jgi:hypothetical protein